MKFLPVVFLCLFMVGCGGDQRPFNGVEERRTFTKTEKIEKLAQQDPRVLDTFQLNTRRNAYYIQKNSFGESIRPFPLCPIFQEFRNITSFPWQFPFVAKLSHVFLETIPDKIKKELDAHFVIAPDIYFSIQKNVDSVSGAGLKAHFWAKQDLSHPDLFKGDIFRENLLMAIYDSDFPIEYEVQNEKLNPFLVYIHEAPGASGISPRNALVNLPAGSRGKSFAVWSVVINPKTHQAVVTLHWVLDGSIEFATRADYIAYLRKFDASVLLRRSEVKTLHDFVSAVDASGAQSLYTSPMVDKLKSLLSF